jgi:hypothetical protein
MKKAAIISIIPIMTFMLSGCGAQKPEPITPLPAPQSTAPITPAAPVVQTTPPATTAEQDAAKAAATKQQATLSTLPTDDKAAIDTELSNIDKELGTTDNLTTQNDLSDTQLGL